MTAVILSKVNQTPAKGPSFARFLVKPRPSFPPFVNRDQKRLAVNLLPVSDSLNRKLPCDIAVYNAPIRETQLGNSLSSAHYARNAAARSWRWSRLPCPCHPIAAGSLSHTDRVDAGAGTVCGAKRIRSLYLPWMTGVTPKLSTTTPPEGLASLSTINDATMRLCRADLPASRHAVAAGGPCTMRARYTDPPSPGASAPPLPAPPFPTRRRHPESSVSVPGSPGHSGP